MICIQNYEILCQMTKLTAFLCFQWRILKALIRNKKYFKNNKLAIGNIKGYLQIGYFKMHFLNLDFTLKIRDNVLVNS